MEGGGQQILKLLNLSQEHTTMQDQPGINSTERMNHWWYEVQAGRIHDKFLADFLTFWLWVWREDWNVPVS